MLDLRCSILDLLLRSSLRSVMFTFFQCADVFADLRLRLDLVFVQQKRPSAVRILQARVIAAAPGIGQRFEPVMLIINS